MSGDFSWSDMPEELGQILYEFQARPQTLTAMIAFLPTLNDWLDKNMVTCNSEAFHLQDVPAGRCGELPVPGSEFCPIHMPKEENDG